MTGYVTGREFIDAAGYLHREHRPGWMRRDDAPVTAATEHPITHDVITQHLTGPGQYIIEEDPW